MTARSQASREGEPRHPRGVRRAWADLPLRSKGLVVVAIPLLALVLATVLFGMAMAQDRRAQAAVLDTMEVEREIAQVRILVQAGATGYVLTGERQYLTSYEQARRELPEAVAHLGDLVSDNPSQADRLRELRGIAAVLLFTSGVTRRVGELERNAERLAGGQPLLPATAGGDVLGQLAGAWSGPGSCSASASRSRARPRPCWSTSWPGARW